jgi:hypothetical protein
MAQINLSQVSGQELRRLLVESRKGRDVALQDAVLRELNARGAHPQKPRNFDAAAVEPHRPAGPASRAAASPAADSFEHLGPDLGAAPRPGVGAAAPRPRAASSHPPALLALVGALALAVVGAGSWLARERMSARPPAPRRALVVINTPTAPAVPSDVAKSPAPARLAPSDLPPPPPLPPPSPPPLPARQPALAVGQNGGPIRLFVHITDEAQIPDVERVRSELTGVRFAGQPVAMPPVRLVRNSPRRTEIRCLKHADCAAAAQVARYLAQDLGTPVAVIDMSPTYEGDPSVRPGSLELWLRPPAGRSG